MKFFVTQMMNALSLGGILFLIASGLNLIFGVMKIVNVAHGSYYMLGGYIGLTVMWQTGNFLLAILGGTISIAILGLVMERFFLRRYHLQDMPQMLLTMGFALVLSDTAFLIWGGDPFAFPIPKFMEGSFHVGVITFPKFRVIAALIAVATAVALWLFIERTSLGAKLRACVDDREIAGAIGINVDRVSGSMFALGAGLAGLGGVIGGPFFGVYPGADFDFLPLCFVVVIVGGLGSFAGSVAGSILVALVDTFGKALFPDLAYFTIFAPMALMVALKPNGLFGRR